MTKEEFARGWAILTAQPWGKSYRGNTPEATIQVELYYKHVNRANPLVWQAVCESHAQGDRWPGLAELKTSLQANGGYAREDVKKLEGPFGFAWEESPWPLKACWTYQKEHECSLREAVLAVLPVWLKENIGHEDYDHAQRFLKKAQENFGMPRRKQGDVRVPL